jgi:predicted Holliday junction resolvase-like endonuclease
MYILLGAVIILLYVIIFLLFSILKTIRTYIKDIKPEFTFDSNKEKRNKLEQYARMRAQEFLNKQETK